MFAQKECRRFPDFDTSEKMFLSLKENANLPFLVAKLTTPSFAFQITCLICMNDFKNIIFRHFIYVYGLSFVVDTAS